MKALDFNFASWPALLGLISVLIGALSAVTKLAWEWRERRTRSRVSGIVKLDLPAVPDSLAIFQPSNERLLFGRETDIIQLRQAVERHSLLFVSGQSGAGKSTLLKVGLCRELYQSRRWLPIVVDIWGSDWITGPWNVLTESVSVALNEGLRPEQKAEVTSGPIRRDNVFEILSRIQSATNVRPIVVFDQLDDYVVQHKDHFLDADTGCYISPDEIAVKNPFWQGVRELLTRDNPVQIIFSIRMDSADSLSPFRFCQEATYRVESISAAACRTVIDTLLPEKVGASPENGVTKPENGFRQLKDRLLRDLGGENGSVLPVRLRVALAGLRSIQDQLTPRAYGRAGGLPGLEASYIENQIATTDNGDPEAIRQLLLLFVIPDEGGIKTRRNVRRDEIKASEQILETLQLTRLLLRRFVPEEGERWSLYHDYLSSGVMEMDRRRRKWEIELARAFDRYRAATSWSTKWRTLLSPTEQARIWWGLVRGRVRLRDRSTFVLASLLRSLSVVALLIVAIAVANYVWINRPSEQARLILRKVDPNERLAASDLWTLTKSSDSVKSEVWRELLEDDSGLQKLQGNSDPLFRALAAYSPSQEQFYAEGFRDVIIGGRLGLESQARIASTIASIAADLRDQQPALAVARYFAAKIIQPSPDSRIQNLLTPALTQLTAHLRDSRDVREFALLLAKEIQNPNQEPRARIGLVPILAALATNLKDGAVMRETAYTLSRTIEESHTSSQSTPDVPSTLISMLFSLSPESADPALAKRLAKAMMIQFARARPGSGESAQVMRALVPLSIASKDQGTILVAANAIFRDKTGTRFYDFQLNALSALCGALEESESVLEFAGSLANEIKSPAVNLQTRQQLISLLATLSTHLKHQAAARDVSAWLVKNIKQTFALHPSWQSLSELATLSAAIKDQDLRHGVAAALAKNIVDSNTEVMAGHLALTGTVSSLVEFSTDVSDQSLTLEIARLISRDIEDVSVEQMRSEVSTGLTILCAHLTDSESAIEFANTLVLAMDQPLARRKTTIAFAPAVAELCTHLKDAHPAQSAARLILNDLRQTDLDSPSKTVLSLALATLVSRVPDRQERTNLMTPILAGERNNLGSCNSALASATRADDAGVAAEMLRWPQCVGSTNYILHIAQERISAGSGDKHLEFIDLGSFLAWVREEKSKGNAVANLDETEGKTGSG